jgi:hypothetical protein
MERKLESKKRIKLGRPRRSQSRKQKLLKDGKTLTKVRDSTAKTKYYINNPYHH